MKIPFGRRQLSISLVSPQEQAGAGASLIEAESDAELARLANQRGATRVRAEQEISRILYAGPPVR